MEKGTRETEQLLQSSRTVRRYLRRERTRGKSVLARVLDALMLFALVFVAVFLYLCGKGIRVRHALLPAGIAVLFSAVVYRMYAVWSMQRFAPQQILRLSKEILQQRMPFLDRSVIRSLCQKVSGTEDPVVFCTAEAVGADVLLPHLRERTDTEQVFCATAGFTKTAQILAAGRTPAVKLIGAEPLLDAAMREPHLRPSIAEVCQKIERDEADRKQRRRQASAFPVGGSGKRYLIAAILLLIFSFRTGYALYYRMLASLCICAAVLRGVLARTVHTEHTA